jgi:hypothetical protein
MDQFFQARIITAIPPITPNIINKVLLAVGINLLMAVALQLLRRLLQVLALLSSVGF